jgi:hypothetical protein
MTHDLGPSRAQIARMRGNITALIREAQRRRRRRARVALGATAAVVAASLTAGIVASVLPDEVVAGAYVCFETDDPAAVAHGMPFPVDLDPPTTTEDQVDAALLLCAIAFERERIDARAPTACRLPDLRLGVFPNVERRGDREFCSSLGLLTPED